MPPTTTLIVWLVLFVGSCFSQSVSTDCGEVSGYEDSGVSIFLGIPYATPPVGSMRWQNSITLKQGNQCWNGVLNTSSFGSQCMQWGGGSEDCLFLNIWTPSLQPSSPLPVMFYIHGGGYNTGNGEWDGIPFIQASNNSVVLVSINYRLNAFGFMALNELSQNSKTNTSGNYGVSDMITALQWVQNNIYNFGGDPKSITIFGQSSGGTGVLMLMISPLATGLFHKAILLSASTRVDKDLAYAVAQNQAFKENANCDNTANTLDCLYALSAEDVLNALPVNEFPYWSHPTDFDLPNITVGDGAFLGIIDGYIIPHSVEAALATARYSDVPVIFGSMAQEVDLNPANLVENYTDAEYNDFITERFQPFNNSDAIISGALSYYSLSNYSNLPQLSYDSMASDIHTTCGQTFLATIAAYSFKSPVYRYIVTQWPSVPMCFGSGYCPHYAFHMWDLISLMESYPSSFTPNVNDTYFARSIQNYFFQLAIDGELSEEWPTINSQGSSDAVSMNFNVPNSIDFDWHFEQCDFWWRNEFYAYSWNS